MTVFSSAAWGSSDGSVAGRVPGCAGEFPDHLRKRTPDWLVRGNGGEARVALALAGAPPGQRDPPQPGDRGAGGS